MNISDIQKRFELIIKGSKDGWWDLDLITNVSYQSDRWWQMLGYNANMDLAEPDLWKTLTHPDDIEPTLSYLRQVLSSKDAVYEIELRLKHQAGHYVPILTRGFVSRDATGVAIRLSGSNTDISELKEKNREITSLNRLLSMITDTNQLIARKPGSVVLFSEVCKIAVNTGGFNLAWVGLLDQNQTFLKCVTYAGDASELIHTIDKHLHKIDFKIPATQCVLEGKQIICNDLQDADFDKKWLDSAIKKGYRSMVALPITQHARVVGNISFFSVELQAFGAKEIALLSELTSDISFSLEVEDGDRQRKLAEKALFDSEALFNTLASNSPTGIFRTNASGALLYTNDRWSIVTAASAQDLKDAKTLPSSIHPDDLKLVTSAYHSSLNDHLPLNIEFRFVHANNKIVWVKCKAQPNFSNSGEFNGLVGTLTDITELKTVEQNLQLAGVVFDSTSETILVTDHNINTVLVNKAFSEIEGYSANEILGKNPNLLKSGMHDDAYFKAMYKSLAETDTFQNEIWNRRKNGELHPGILSINAIRNISNQVTHYVSIFTDITKLKDTEERLVFLANHDPLTGLPNRMMLIPHIEHAINSAKRNHKRFALLLLDLDHFKHINDSFGHLAGDELLKQVATRLKKILRANDMVCRLGGDEFVVLLEDIEKAEYVEKVANNINQQLSKPWVLDNGASIYSGASIGICEYPKHGESALELLKNADAAMYQAKASGRGLYKYYTEILTIKTQQRYETETRLRAAIKNNELVLHYQPKLDVPTGKVVGVEALVRWADPKHGLIMPNEFIPVAEENGLIIELGKWVLNEACTQGQIWLNQGLDLSIAVNLSASQLYNSDIISTLKEILQTTGFAAKKLELEVTESILMLREAECVEKLQNIKALGIKIAIDDFGTGYSSLAYLREFPLNILKIDRTFIANLVLKDDRALTAAIINIGRTLRLQVVAEGVENKFQLDFLESHGCQLYQGFYACRAVNKTDFEAFLKNYQGDNIF